MHGHFRAGSHRRVEEDYEQDRYDEYDDYEEEDVSEDEYEIKEQEERKPTKEELDYLKSREKLKEKYRQKLKKESASTFGRSGQSQGKTTAGKDNFGSFFGPSKPVIAARVLEESRSIRETHHISAKATSSSTSYKKGPVSTFIERKTHANDQRPQLSAHDQRRQKAEEVTNKAKSLKVMRDYSFLKSDDADLPEPVKEEPTPRKVHVPNSRNDVRPTTMNARPAPRSVAPPVSRSVVTPVRRSLPQKDSVQNSDGRSAKATVKSKTPDSLPARSVSNGHGKNFSSASRHMQLKQGSKDPPMNRSKPTSVEVRKGIGTSVGHGSGRLAGREALPKKVPSLSNVVMKAPTKITNGGSVSRRPESVKHNTSSQSHHSEHRRVSQVQGTPKKPLPSSKLQPTKPSQQTLSRGTHQERPRKRPSRREDSDEENGAGAIQLIRNMFRYNPNKYRQMDDEDDSDMEADFDTIMEEEDRSLRIARKEDAEQLRLLEEEEERQRMRKKRKMSGRR